MRQDLVLKRPIITEKTMALAQLGKFTFEVDPEATKQSIAQAVENYFNVEVTKVSTVTLHGKTKRFGVKRQPKKLADIHKAVVELKKGQKIDLFEVKEEEKK